MIPDARRWRRWTWALLAWTVAMVAVAVVATTMLGNICEDLEGLGFRACSAGTTAGTVIALIVVLWAWLVGFLFLALAWFARRPARRLCPPYGHPVEMGATACPRCGYDFVTGALPVRVS